MTTPKSKLSLKERMDRLDGKIPKEKQPIEPWIISGWVLLTIPFVLPVTLLIGVGFTIAGMALSIRLLTIPNKRAKINGGILLLLFIGSLSLAVYRLIH